MQKLTVMHFRLGLVVFSAGVVFVLSAPLPGEAGRDHWPILPVVALLALLLFKFRIVETVTIADGELVFALQGITAKIAAKEITGVVPFDCWNKVRVSTESLQLELSLRRFDSRRTEKFFMENGLCPPESFDG